MEEGIAALVQSDAAVARLAAAGGGFPAGELPKGIPLPTWTFLCFGGEPTRALHAKPGLRMRRLQIDCYSQPTADDAVQLSAAIEAVLDGFSGALPDADRTIVDNCVLSEEPTDSWNPVSKSYRRMTEYEIHFFSN